MKHLVVFPGAFAPFHDGHFNAFETLQSNFPNDRILLSATNSRTKQPFTFDEKKTLAIAAGINPKDFIEVKKPYDYNEYMKYIKDPENTVLVFAISKANFEGDRPRFGFTVADIQEKNYEKTYKFGDSVFKLYNPDDLKPISEKVVYIYPIEVIGFGISGKDLWKNWMEWDDKKKKQYIKYVYPHAEYETIKELLDHRLLQEWVFEVDTREILSEEFFPPSVTRVKRKFKL